MGDGTMWDRNGLHVWAELRPDGTLVIQGQDLSSGPFGASEYEYGITVQRADVPRVVEALGGPVGADVVGLLVANGEAIVHAGELTWSKSLGITPEFSSRSDFADDSFEVSAAPASPPKVGVPGDQAPRRPPEEPSHPEVHESSVDDVDTEGLVLTSEDRALFENEWGLVPGEWSDRDILLAMGLGWF